MLKQMFTVVFISTLAATAGAGPIPDVVLQDADAYANALARALRLPQLPVWHTLRNEYAVWFFQG